MGSGEGRKVVSITLAGNGLLNEPERGISHGRGSPSGPYTSSKQCSTLRWRTRAKKHRLSKTAVIFNADNLISNGAHNVKPEVDAEKIQNVKFFLQAAEQENAKLQLENESLIKSLLVKTDILKATLAAKKLIAANASHGAQPPAEVEEQACPSPSIGSHMKSMSLCPTLNNSSSAAAVVAAAAAVAGSITSLDSPIAAPGAAAFPGSPSISTTENDQVSSYNGLLNFDIDYADFTSSMIIIQSHQGDLKLMLQEADEEGLSTDLMASIESTVAETSKIYANLMSQRRKHPAITNTIACDDFYVPHVLDGSNDKNAVVHSRTIASIILQRLGQKALMALNTSWESHRQNVELIQQKQARLEMMRASLERLFQAKRMREAWEVAAGYYYPEDAPAVQTVSGKERASAFLALNYLEKTARDVYWEEWDAIDKFEGTCCEILGTYNTAIMYVQSAPASPNCAAIVKEVLSLAAASGRLCLAT